MRHKKDKNTHANAMSVAYQSIRRNLGEHWGIIGVSLYLICLGLALPASVSNALVCILALLMIFYGSKTTVDVDKSVVVAVTLFLLATAVSLFASVDSARSAILSLSLFPSAVLFYLLVYYLKSQHIIYLLIVLTLLSLLISGQFLYTALTSTFGHPINWLSELSLSYLATPNDLLFIALIAPLSLALLPLSQRRSVQTLVVVSLCAAMVAMVVYRSNIALLVVFVGLSITAVLLWRQRALVVLAIAFASVLAIDGLQNFQMLLKVIDPEVWGNRLPLWLAAFNMFLDAPLLGMGPGSFSLMSEAYMQNQLLPAWVKPDPRHEPWAHNLYLELLAERGIIGLFAFLFLIVTLLKNLIPMLSFSSLTPHRARLVLSSSLLACIIALLVGGLFELSILRHWFIVLTAVLCALTLGLRNQQANWELRR